MNSTPDLQDIVFDTLESMSVQTVIHYEDNNMRDAAAILAEWTDTADQCILTHYLADTTETLEEELMYIIIDEQIKELGLGSFTFVPEELPINEQWHSPQNNA